MKNLLFLKMFSENAPPNSFLFHWSNFSSVSHWLQEKKIRKNVHCTVHVIGGVYKEFSGQTTALGSLKEIQKKNYILFLNVQVF